MDVADRGNQPELALEVLKHVEALLHTLTPELQRSLGDIAARGADVQSTLWLHEVNDTAERMYADLGLVFAVINDTPVVEIEEPEESGHDQAPEITEILPMDVPVDVAEPETTVAEVEATVETETHPILSHSDIEIIEFLKTRKDPTQVNLGEIIKKHIGIPELDRRDKKILIDTLNRLSELGYMRHLPRTAWYGIGERDIDEQPPLAFDESLVPLVETEELVVEQPESEPALQPIAIADVPEPKEAIVLGLTEREQLMYDAILQFTTVDEWFAQKQVDLTSIEFPSEFARRQAFTKLTQKLQELGLLINNGVARGGKKYTLTDKAVASPVAEKATPITHVPVKVRKERTPQPKFFEQKQAEETNKKPEPKHELTPRERAQQERKAAIFAGRLAKYITGHLETKSDQKEKLSLVAKDVAARLEITIPVARTAIKHLVESNFFYYNGPIRGARMLGLTQPETPHIPKRRRKQSAETAEELEAIKNWSANDVDAAIEVFDTLLTLRHVQQGISIKNLWKESLMSDVDEDSYRRSIRRLESKGYVIIDKNANVTRSPHSRKLRIPLVKFVNQAFKERWKTDKAGIINELRKLVDVV